MFRGLQVVEHACSAPSLLQGETLANIARDMDTQSYRVPLGVCAGIAPFNFPAMIPLWMFPLALMAGNTYVLKPSERVPGATMILMELLNEIQLPKGVVNVIHGAHQAVDFLCENPAVRALSFVGSDQAGEHIYKKGGSMVPLRKKEKFSCRGRRLTPTISRFPQARSTASACSATWARRTTA